MTQHKSTRARLVASALALLLCCAMLVGTTFAWFSDEAKTGDTTITAGNLDVALMVDETGEDTFTEATTETHLFDETKPSLWEPGVMAVSKAFYVQNNGTLALQYSLNAKIAEETKVNGHSLTEVIKMKVTTKDDPALKSITENPEATIADRRTAWENLDAEEGELGSYAQAGVLLPEGYTGEPTEGQVPYEQQEANEKVIVLFWNPSESTSVDDRQANPDNDYNLPKDQYDGSEPSVKFAVDVFATQTPAESDSFGTQYDNIKIAASADQFADALENGVPEVSLEGPIELGSTNLGPIAGGTSIDGNGNTLTLAPSNTLGSYNLTLKGGTADNPTVLQNINIQAADNEGYSKGITIDGGTGEYTYVTLKNVKADMGGNTEHGNIALKVTGNVHVTVTDSTFKGITALQVDGDGSGSFGGVERHKGKPTVTLDTCKLEGVKEIDDSGEYSYGVIRVDNNLDASSVTLQNCTINRNQTVGDTANLDQEAHIYIYDVTGRPSDEAAAKELLSSIFTEEFEEVKTANTWQDKDETAPDVVIKWGD